MKKSLLALTALAAFTMISCNAKKPGGGSKPSGDPTNGMKAAIEFTEGYKGSYSATYNISGVEAASNFISYNAETHEYVAMNSEGKVVGVPQANNLSKYYNINPSNPSSSEYKLCSTSYVDRMGQGAIFDDDMLFTGTIGFKAMADSYGNPDTKDTFKKFLINEINESMLGEMGVYLDVNEATSTLNFGKEDELFTASFGIAGTAKTLEATEYPRVDFEYTISLKYTDRIVEFGQTMSFDYIMGKNAHMNQAMFAVLAVDYAFDQETYAENKAVADTVVKDAGTIDNGVKLVFNGDLEESFSDRFAPNSTITLDKVLASVDSYYRNHADITVYLDKECTRPFEERASTEYKETFYIQMTPQTGYTFIKEIYHDVTEKGDLPFTDKEFEFYKEVFDPEERTKVKYTCTPTGSDFNVVYHYSWQDGRLIDMTFDGEPFNSNIIAADKLGGKAEHELVFNTVSVEGQSGYSTRPLLVNSFMVSNDETGMLIAGPLNQYGVYYKVRATDYMKVNPAKTCVAYKVDHVLAEGEDLPGSAVLLDSTQVKIHYYVDEAKFDSVPADCSEFMVYVQLLNDASFVYLKLS